MIKLPLFKHQGRYYALVDSVTYSSNFNSCRVCALYELCCNRKSSIPHGVSSLCFSVMGDYDLTPCDAYDPFFIDVTEGIEV